ncbi:MULTISPECIES: isocitrate lyase/PEP mutase family protein [Cohaesibacter]|uniref:isocitrate lyase/PEP mutase family protein n=1 Tax=Cohaesibacter TaxID=655352 RepID=UPI000DEA675F|nr:MULTISPECIES: isocitrate lyase/phosphoenolpyruvate mutase family protein [Cohaesibacter]TLP45674.1 isocitrate lyase/phosphoenolpyruvate mutase family protein [Cohaesibacter sp. CAU 1516]
MTIKVTDRQIEKAKVFHSLHVKGRPLVLYNIWDAGGAKAISDCDEKAVGTGSASVAAAHGYGDGEEIPLDLVMTIVERITATVDLPVTIDFEGAYAQTPEGVAENVLRLVAAGAIGCNFEDQIIGTEDLYSIEEQAARIRAIREATDALGLPFFINARSDIFLHAHDDNKHKDLMSETKERAIAYTEAGADGFFVPWLRDSDLLAELCNDLILPVNAFKRPGIASNKDLAKLGIARISYGPSPYRVAIVDLIRRIHEKD